MNETYSDFGRRLLFGGVLLCALLAAPAAFAQAGSYSYASASGTFTRMSGGTSLAIGGGGYTGLGAPVALGFPMKFYGQPFTSVFVNSSGQVIFGSSTGTATRSYGTKLGAGGAPNNWVSPWWGYSASPLSLDDVTYKITGSAGNHVATFQWENYGYYYNGYYPRSMQVILHEATRAIELAYGPIGTGPYSYDAGVAGAEDATGANPVSVLSCNTNSNGCSYTSWPASGTTITLTWATSIADLAAAVVVESVTPLQVNGAAKLEVKVKTTLFNLGKTAASNFGFDVFHSTDAAITAADTLLVSHPATITLPALGSATFDDTVTLDRPANGEVFIGVILDPANAITEADKSNNAISADPFALGVDLFVNTVKGPTTAGLLDTVSLTATIGNRGSDGTPAKFGIYLSDDPLIDPAKDKRIGEATYTLAGNETRNVTMTGTIPASLSVTPGATDFYFGVVADPDLALTELTRVNNIAAAPGKLALVLPDVKPENRVARGTEFYFGEKATVEFDLQNDGDADAHDVTAILLLSDNAVITLNDQQIFEVNHLEIPKHGKLHLIWTDVAIPLNLENGKPYPSGNYYFGVIIDPDRKIPEVNEANNAAAIIPAVKLRQPAPDFAAVRVDGPLVAAGGDVLPISRLIRNLGNRGNDLTGKAYRYRLFLSENQIVSPQDRLLKLVVNGVEKDFGTGRLGAQGEDRSVDLARVPNGIPEGSYYLGLIVDPDNEIDELREDNNVVSSGALVTVSGRALAIVTSYLPDATEKVSYTQQLGAAGGDRSYFWRVVPGQGELPPGVTLSSAGLLEGAPLQAGSYAFTVEVASGALVDNARYGLRVYKPSGTLVVATQLLPTAVEKQAYGTTVSGPGGIRLAATGGVAPYAWTLLPSSSLPSGMSFSAGLLSGTPAPGSAGSFPLSLTVVDALGAAANAALELRVVAPGTLAFDLRELPLDGHAGSPYTFAFPVIGGKPPYKASVSSGGVPEGLTLTAGADRAFLTGKPVRPGFYPFTLVVTDANQVKVARPFLISVTGGNVAFRTERLPDATPGASYDSFVEATSSEKVTFRLASGVLPAGLSMDELGSIRGTVEATASSRVHDFVVEARDRSGNVGMRGFGIYVKHAEDVTPAAPRGFGCSAGGESLGSLGLLALASLRRRRRSA